MPPALQYAGVPLVHCAARRRSGSDDIVLAIAIFTELAHSMNTHTQNKTAEAFHLFIVQH